MGRTSPINDVNDADKMTNDGASKMSSSSSENATTARLSNMQKAIQAKKRKSSLDVVNAKKSFCAAAAEPAPVPSILFEEPPNAKPMPAEIGGQNDRARSPKTWKFMVNSRKKN